MTANSVTFSTTFLTLKPLDYSGAFTSYEQSQVCMRPPTSQATRTELRETREFCENAPIGPQSHLEPTLEDFEFCDGCVRGNRWRTTLQDGLSFPDEVS